VTIEEYKQYIHWMAQQLELDIKSEKESISKNERAKLQDSLRKGKIKVDTKSYAKRKDKSLEQLKQLV